jgi:CheY-like chemotaxis protein
LIRRILEENVDVVVSTTESLPPVLIDPGRLEQVLMNLCVNARDAMPTGGELRISTSQRRLDAPHEFSSGVAEPGHYIVIETKDTGSGMTQEVLGRIFEPFFTTKPAGRGTGLGLATVHGIVKDAGGVIDVDSQLARGTTFRIYLPAEQSSALVDEERTPTPKPTGTGTSILLCEDEETVRTMMLRILSKAGFDVTAVASGTIALKALEQRAFDLLITDAVMPEMDGGQLAQLAQDKYPRLPVLFVSGYTGGVLERHGVEEDSLRFLRKPFRSQELLERVSQILAAHRSSGASASSTIH